MAGSRWLKFLGFGGNKRTAKVDRPIIREIREMVPRHLLQVGLADGELAGEILRAAKQAAGGETVALTAIDPFETAADPSRHLSLREAYRRFREEGVQARLLPGPWEQVLPAQANHIRNVDFAIITLEAAAPVELLWQFLPRTLNASAIVYVRQADHGSDQRPDGRSPENVARVSAADQESEWQRLTATTLPVVKRRRAA